MIELLAYGLLMALLLTFGAYLTRTSGLKRMRAIADQGALIDPSEDKFNLYLGLLTNTQVVGGNRIEVLFNGDGTFPRLWDDLEQAREVICVHVYFFKPGQLADRLLRVLSERAQAGVKVLVLLDAVGAGEITKGYRERLRSSGAEVARYRPFRFAELYKFQQRMHMRAVIIDGRIGFTGGFGIADQWLGDGRSPDQWRDTNVRVEGPVAMQLQVAFSVNWAEATGELLVGEGITPFDEAPRPTEPVAAGVMTCSPSFGTTNAERFFFLAIASARKRIYIANAYFVPPRGLRWLLMNAADRGVDVRILTPGANTDEPLAWHACRATYQRLMDAGIRIYEYRPGMMHAKTFIVDGCWATVGTFNFDNRSMKLNDEVALIIRDESIAKCLEESFLEDLELADEVPSGKIFAGRVDALKGRLARLVSPVL
jgi:cardiolipin synthase